MLRYKTETRPGLVTLYDIWPGNGAGPFLQLQSPHRAPSNWESSDVALVRISEKAKQSNNFVYAITKYVSLPLTLSSLIINVNLTLDTPSFTNDDSYLQQKLDFKL